MNDDPYDLKNLALRPELVPQRPAGVPRKIQKRREHFVLVPITWIERLDGAAGRTWQVALFLLYQDWKHNGDPIKLPNGMLRYDGVGRHAKWRALAELERRRLISIERRPNRSPLIRLAK